MGKELCIDARMWDCTGIGTSIQNLLKNFLHGPFKLRVITHPDLVEKFPELNNFDVILTSAPIYSIQEQIRLPLLIPSCDIFWSPHFNIPLTRIRAKKRVVTLHDATHLIFFKWTESYKKIYAKFMISQALQKADRILMSSSFTESEIAKYMKTDKSKIHVIPFGVDCKHFSYKDSIDSSEDTISCKLPERFFLFVGRVSFVNKNFIRLAQAWRRIIQEFPDWKLVVVGKQARSKSLEKIFKQDPELSTTILFLGKVSDAILPYIYSRAYAVVSPSLYEGFGLIPLEAMGCGKPVVCSQAASLPEVVGESALYIDPYNEKDIARGIRELILNSNLYNELVEKGLLRVKQFSWEKSAEEHLKVFESLV